MSLLSDTFAPINTSRNNLFHYNTGTLFDLGSGYFVQGYDGKMYLNGGLGCQIHAVVGQNGHFKSSFALGQSARVRAIYKTTQVVADTEDSVDQDQERVETMTEELFDRTSREDVKWLAGAEYPLEEVDLWIQKHCHAKMAKGQDIYIDTPFIDPETGKRHRQILPTVIDIDSFSELISKDESDKTSIESPDTEKAPLSDSSIKTVWMGDGNKKTMFTRLMRQRCEKYGLILVLTGHYDQKMAIDQWHPNVKETLFGKQDWAVKNVGSKFKFLSSIYIRTAATCLQDSNKEAMYSLGKTTPTDIFEVSIAIDRCKAAVAGTITPFICSQTNGLLNAATNYNYIRLDKYYGCKGSAVKQQLCLLPDLTISRNTIRQLAEDNGELRRALEITAQLCFIKNNWNFENVPYDLKTDPKNIFDWLMSDKHKTLRDDILHSRGWWSPYEEELPYMSVVEIMDAINKD